MNNFKTREEVVELFRNKYVCLQTVYPSVGAFNEYDIHCNPDGGWQLNLLPCAAITLRPGDDNAHIIYDAVCERWYQEGGAFDKNISGWLGYPAEDQTVMDVGVCPPQPLNYDYELYNESWTPKPIQVKGYVAAFDFGNILWHSGLPWERANETNAYVLRVVPNHALAGDKESEALWDELNEVLKKSEVMHPSNPKELCCPSGEDRLFAVPPQTTVELNEAGKKHVPPDIDTAIEKICRLHGFLPDKTDVSCALANTEDYYAMRKTFSHSCFWERLDRQVSLVWGFYVESKDHDQLYVVLGRDKSGGISGGLLFAPYPKLFLKLMPFNLGISFRKARIRITHSDDESGGYELQYNWFPIFGIKDIVSLRLDYGPDCESAGVMVGWAKGGANLSTYERLAAAFPQVRPYYPGRCIYSGEEGYVHDFGGLAAIVGPTTWDTSCFEVHGGIYCAWKDSGGVLGPLGRPVSDETDYHGYDARAGDRCSKFQNGFIVWRADTCKTELHVYKWRDEFDGHEIDTSKWSFYTGDVYNNELQRYADSPENAYIKNGVLHIRANKKQSGGSKYVSARLMSKDKFSFTYGKVEARIALPAGQGIWPAFWMLGVNEDEVGHPACGEIDIIEAVNKENVIYGTCHWFNNGLASHGKSTADFYGANLPLDIRQFHIYTLVWDKKVISMYVDGFKYNEMIIENNVGGTDAFHKPFYLILNVAVGGNWPGFEIDDSQFPNEMLVDYIRVFD